jgi:hypothetical protein
MFIRSQLSSASHCVSITPNNALYIKQVVTTLEKCVTPHNSDMYLKNQVSNDLCCLTFFAYFLGRNHTRRAYVRISFHSVYCQIKEPG